MQKTVTGLAWNCRLDVGPSAAADSYGGCIKMGPCSRPAPLVHAGHWDAAHCTPSRLQSCSGGQEAGSSGPPASARDTAGPGLVL